VLPAMSIIVLQCNFVNVLIMFEITSVWNYTALDCTRSANNMYIRIAWFSAF